MFVEIEVGFETHFYGNSPVRTKKLVGEQNIDGVLIQKSHKLRGMRVIDFANMRSKFIMN